MNSDEMDIRVIKNIRTGDRDAYADIVESYKGLIYNLAFRMTGSLSDAEDLAQDVFIRVFETLDRFDDSKRFFPWMYMIALNLIRNHLKRNKPILLRFKKERFTDESLKHIDTPEKSVSEKQQRRNLDRRILGLPLKKREAIVLRYYQGLPFEEIAEIQSCSVSAAKMRVYRSLKQLKRLMNSV